MNKSQRQIRKSLKLLGIKRLHNFIRHNDIQDSNCKVVSFLKDALEEGRDLEEELLGRDDPVDNFMGSGYVLRVKPLGNNCFKIEIGYHAGGTTGDGGDWEVTFDDEGNVVNIIHGGFWIA